MAASVVFNWQLYRRHFIYYELFLVLSSVLRSATKKEDVLLMAAISLIGCLPIAAVAAFFATRQPAHIEGAPIPKPRIWKSIAFGLVACAVAVAIALAARG